MKKVKEMNAVSSGIKNKILYLQIRNLVEDQGGLGHQALPSTSQVSREKTDNDKCRLKVLTFSDLEENSDPESEGKRQTVSVPAPWIVRRTLDKQNMNLGGTR